MFAHVVLFLAELALLVAYLFFMDVITSLTFNWWFVVRATC